MADDAGARWAGLLDDVAGALERLGGEGWIVGGCLRDALLREAVRDVDLAVTCEPLALAQALKRERSLTIAILNRDSARLGVRGADGEPPLQLDISPLSGGSIASDLRQRDFRVNALALPLAARTQFVALLDRAHERTTRRLPSTLPSLIDPLGGVADLRARAIVPASDHALEDDPGRVIRAARLAARFGFSASPALLEAAWGVAVAVPTLSGDRLRDELNALMALPRAADGLDLLAEMGGLVALFPNLSRDGALAHALASVRAASGLQDGGNVCPEMAPLSALAPLRAWYAAALPDGLPRIVVLRWGLLLHAPLSHLRSNAADAPEGPDSERSDAVAIRNDASIHQAALARGLAWKIALYGHAAWMQELAADGDLRRARFFFERLGDAAVDALAAGAACNAALAVAPVEGQRTVPGVAEMTAGILRVYFAERERLVPPRLLTGNDLIRELGMAPGRELGVVLYELRHAQLDGQVRTREEALAWARALAR